MTDVSGSKTMTLLLAIVLLSTFLYVARLSRRNASGSEALMSDGTTHADGGARRDAGTESHAAPSPRWKVPAPTRRDPGVPNRALAEMEAIEATLPTPPAPDQPLGGEAPAPAVDMGPMNGS